jgi:hypothetical protein
MLEQINREEAFKLSQARNPAFNILQATDTDNFNNIRWGEFRDGQEKQQWKKSSQQMGTGLQVKQQGTEPKMGGVATQFDSTLQSHGKLIRMRHQQH